MFVIPGLSRYEDDLLW